MTAVRNDLTLPTLPHATGTWRAIYWEPVMQTGERLCVGFLTVWDQSAKAELTIRPDLLVALFGAAGQKVQALLERSFRVLNAQLRERPVIEAATAPISGLYFGGIETSHVNSYVDLLRVAKLMSSSLCTLSDPDYAEGSEVGDSRSEQALPARQFATRVRDLTLRIDASLAGYFGKEATLMATRRSTRFGFLSDRLAAHFGLIQPSNIRVSVRMARGLITELSLAKRASGRAGLLIVGFPPLASPNLTDKERSAIEDYAEELGLEAAEFDVKFQGADNDRDACAALMAAL